MRTRLKQAIGFIIFSIALTLLSLNVYAQSQTDPVVNAFANFHFQNNQLLQSKTQQLFDYFQDSEDTLPEDFTNKFSPPLALDSESCADNLSSSCLNYLFEENLNQLIPQVQSSLNFVEVSNLSNISDSQARQSRARFQFIQDQFDASLDTVESSLNFYQQLLQAYPMHLSYESTKDELDILISNLQELESYVDQYPSKYNNVTTPYCQ